MRASVSVFDAPINGESRWCVTLRLVDVHEEGELTSSVWTDEFSETQERLCVAFDSLYSFIRHGSMFAQPLSGDGWQVFHRS